MKIRKIILSTNAIEEKFYSSYVELKNGALGWNSELRQETWEKLIGILPIVGNDVVADGTVALRNYLGED
jgi:hypothetical protein